MDACSLEKKTTPTPWTAWPVECSWVDKVEGYYTIAKEGSVGAEGGIDEEVFKCLKGLLPETLSGLKALDVGGGDAR